MRSSARNGLTVLSVAAGYYACAVIGTLLSVPPSGFSIIWPATAFLTAILLLLPRGRWWLCALGAIPTHFYLAATFQPHAPLVVVATQVIGNLGTAVATAFAVRRMTGNGPIFDTFGSVLKFILIAGVAVPAVMNALILCVHLATGWTRDFWLAWRQWMIAGFFPAITIPPLLVLTTNGGVTGRPAASPRTRVELALLALLLLALGLLVFGGDMDPVHWPALFLAPFPLLLWAALRLGVGGTSISLLAVATATIVQALRHEGPFAAHSPIEDVVSLQIFLITASAPLMLLAAIVDEHRRMAGLLRRSEARMELAASSTDTGLWQWDVRAQELWLTQNCRAIFGLTAEATLSPYAFLNMVHPEDRARATAAIDAALTDGKARPPVEFRVGAGDRSRWILLDMHSDVDDAGAPVCVSGVFKDVTDRIEAQREADRLRQRLVHLQDDERRRVAEELHESTAQHLAAASLNLFNLEARISAEKQDLVEEIRRSVGEAVREIRTFAYLLHPPQLNDDSLSSVLREYVPGFERRTGVRTALRISPLADRLPPDQQQAILRIAQESLGNVHRHARAKAVSVSVRCISDIVHLIVRDDGDGIRPEIGQRLSDRLRLGIGIPAMRARVRQYGRLDGASPTKGTTLHVAFPLYQADSTPDTAAGFSLH